MKLRGGYNVLLAGRPDGAIQPLPEPAALHLPLWSRRLSFSKLTVTEGQRIEAGQVLATDPGRYDVPLLAPRAGVVRLGSVKNHVTLEDLSPGGEGPPPRPVAPEGASPAETLRRKLVALGAWQHFADAHTGGLPDPLSQPKAVLVSALSLEPFVLRGDVQLFESLPAFLRGLERLQSLLEYQPIYLVLPSVQWAFAAHVRDALRGHAWLKLVDIPHRQGLDIPAVIARALGHKRSNGLVWAVRTEGVLAIDRALTQSLPCTERVIALGGPAVLAPTNYRAMTGYPLAEVLRSRVAPGSMRVVNGGVLTGEVVGPEQAGLDAECLALAVLPEHERREMLSFARPGLDRRSYSRCFLSALRQPAAEALTTSLRGERRACVSCGFCQEVCPAGIMPHQIHKYLYRDDLELAFRAGVDLCVGCGLCSFVCPSKIELRQQMLQAQQDLEKEQAQEVPA